MDTNLQRGGEIGAVDCNLTICGGGGGGGGRGLDRETVEVTGWIQTCKGEER